MDAKPRILVIGAGSSSFPVGLLARLAADLEIEIVEANEMPAKNAARVELLADTHFTLFDAEFRPPDHLWYRRFDSHRGRW